MSDPRFRAITRDDAAAVNVLMGAAEAVDHTEEHYNLADVLEDLENPMIELAKDWVVVELDGELVAHCRLLPRAPADGAISVAVDGTVHPDHRRHGIGSRMIAMMVQRALDHVSERGADLRPVVTASALSDSTDAAAVLAKLGMRAERFSFVMRADLGTAPEEEPGPGLPEGYTVQTWEGLEHAEIMAAHNQAFVGHYGWTPWNAEMWDQWVARSRSARPALSLVARDRTGAIAAYIQSEEYDAVTEATGVKEAFVAKVGTLEAHRRKGLAEALLKVALQRYRAAGYERAALDVDSENPTGALRVYERAGFQTHLSFTNYRLDA